VRVHSIRTLWPGVSLRDNALGHGTIFRHATRPVDAALNLESMGREGKQEGLGEALAALEREMALVTSALEKIAEEAV